MRAPGETAERLIARVADRAHGVVSRRELLEVGVTRSEIEHRLRTGGLLREYPGVFRVGHRAPSVIARYAAAIKACGDGSRLSGRAAGYVYGLVRGGPPPAEVTAPRRRRVHGVKTRQARSGDQRDVTRHRDLAITTVPRTLVDLAAELGSHELGRVCHEAGARYGTTPAQVEAALERKPNAPGAARLRRILRGDEPITLSKLERRFYRLLRDHGLPLPDMNRYVGGRCLDCRWADPPLTVELDGYRYHRSRHAWERDRRREREARARGDDFRRYTYGDVYDDSTPMLEELRTALGG
jgi:hypothetical protein